MNTADFFHSDDRVVQPDWLAQRLGDDRLRILDCTTYMFPQPVGPSRIESGHPDYLKGHLPGAQHVDMVQDLSDPAGAFPYTLPPASQIERLLSRLGVGNDHLLVLYARSSPMTVTRAWYVLHAMGHARLYVLDGGFSRWQREERPVVADLPSFAPTVYRTNPRPALKADREQVQAALGKSDVLLANALSAEQFKGTGGAHYGRPGRIPGSQHVPARDVADPDSHAFLPLPQLRNLYATRAITAAPKVITYCGGGIAATATAFALERLGHSNWAVYDNSLLEWAADPTLPMER